MKKKDTALLFLSVGVVFLIIGLVQQHFLLTFKSGFFNLGVIFTLSGLVAFALAKKFGSKE
ncbi:hypothetical protein J7K93_05185 [bacterium]|nr:hypothetical protein [bacterium]